jgi:hypothetical protein
LPTTLPTTSAAAGPASGAVAAQAPQVLAPSTTAFELTASGGAAAKSPHRGHRTTHGPAWTRHPNPFRKRGGAVQDHLARQAHRSDHPAPKPAERLRANRRPRGGA